MKEYFWVPLVALLYILQAFLTVKNNIHGGKWTTIFLLVTLFTPWVWISKYSKNLLFDSLLFDSILLVSYGLGIAYFTNSFSKLSQGQYFGMFLVFVGIFLFKKGA